MKSGSEALVVSTATTSSSNNETSQSYDSAGRKENASVLRVFKLAELRSATNDFNQTLKIGGGEFGSVYKGFLKPLDEKSGRITVAVKVLFNQRGWQIIHRDFNPSNVLLDGDFNAKLSDFGLAREGPTGDKTYVSTTVIGTYAYLAPEYRMSGHLSTKSDVWGFGLVLYELLTGRCSTTNEEWILDWIEQFPIESKRFNMIMDPRLRYHYSMKTVREVAELANRCLVMEAMERPKMSEVVGVLKQVVEMTEMASGGKVEGKRKGKRPEPSSS